MYITIDLLYNMPSGATACIDARRWFADKFPRGGTLEEVWNACDNVSWKIWFTCHYLSMEQRQTLAFKFAGQAMRFAGIEQYADNITAENWRDAKSAADAAAATAAYAVAYAAYAADDAAYAAYAADAAYAVATAAYAVRYEQMQWCWEALAAQQTKVGNENTQ